MKTLFLDTNIFLQCKDINQLPWSEISGNEDLLLLIPRQAQVEIDELKHSGNSRRTQRARKANSFIRNILLSQNFILTIKDSNPKILISFPPPLNIEDSDLKTLNLTYADDRIIAEAIAYRNHNPKEKVALLTHDTNPILTAKRCELECILIPDSWLLEPEPDQKDKKIHALETRLAELEKSSPQITIKAEDDNGKQINSLTVQVVRFEKLTDSEIEKFVADVKAKYPMVTTFNTKRTDPFREKLGMGNVLGMMREYKPPSENEIQQYTEVEYPKWLNEVKEFFKSLCYKLKTPRRKIVLPILVNNDGNVPAENVIVEFEVTEGLFLERPEVDPGNRTVV